MPPLNDHRLFAEHPRAYAENAYVYPVVSRRAGGVSIGVNLNRNRFCNFDCVYCQVDRRAPSVDDADAPIDLPRLAAELDAAIDSVQSGKVFESPRFAAVPNELRRLNDIALSGDGEPTACEQFVDVAEALVDARRRHGLDAKLVVITNASLLHVERVNAGLDRLAAHGGEIWAKLDAGTEDYYRQVSRSRVPWARILDNLRATAIARPIVIQTLFMRVHGQPPSDDEVAAYAERLAEITAAGGRISLVQLHTVARRPAESWAEPLSNEGLERLAEAVRRRSQLPVQTFPAS
jgi:wyosine [tRNA(Phe)-imidazoG37] synthetase (radical SAM superfamily)